MFPLFRSPLYSHHHWIHFSFSGVPIALCCIAPMLAAKVFGSEGVHITLGKKGDETKVLGHFTIKLYRFA